MSANLHGRITEEAGLDGAGALNVQEKERTCCVEKLINAPMPPSAALAADGWLPLSCSSV